MCRLKGMVSDELWAFPRGDDFRAVMSPRGQHSSLAARGHAAFASGKPALPGIVTDPGAKPPIRLHAGHYPEPF